ncbi:hypothetical protein NQZ68_002632 [Dissostichus eleginoides]|nr:hypothetical protein NQZ68_002632 [Dissostichus eleginoides]
MTKCVLRVATAIRHPSASVCKLSGRQTSSAHHNSPSIEENSALTTNVCQLKTWTKSRPTYNHCMWPGHKIVMVRLGEDGKASF